MTRVGTKPLIIAFLMLLAFAPGLRGQMTNGAPDFKEVYELIRSNASGLSEAELNRAAVDGLVSALGSRVSLVTNDAAISGATDLPIVSKAGIFEDIAYLRVTGVTQGLAKAVTDAYTQLSSTNKVKGIVLDLRYAGGTDYQAAAETAELFVSKDQPLLNWGNGMISSREKTNAIAVPVAVLINRQTAGAPEALAAVLREAGAGLILGSRSAGRAVMSKNFALKSGGQLRIAAAPVTLGNGDAMPSDGVKPDIDVSVAAEDERAYYADAFRIVPRTNLVGGAALSSAGQPNATNPPRRVRFNEADLVRERKEGIALDSEIATRTMEPQTPVVSDPALARALDLLKGLAVVRQSRF